MNIKFIFHIIYNKVLRIKFIILQLITLTKKITYFKTFSTKCNTLSKMKILYKFRNKHSELYLNCYYCEHWWMFTYSSRLAE